MPKVGKVHQRAPNFSAAGSHWIESPELIFASRAKTLYDGTLYARVVACIAKRQIALVTRAIKFVVILGMAGFNAVAPQCADAQTSKWIKTGVTGRLIYVPDAQGDRILDFSNVGYKGRGNELVPNDIPTVMTISQIAGDDTANIQAAINAVSAMPMQPNGYRGALLLTAGDYDIATQLTINASGVVLRGVGRETTGTVLHARGTTQRTLVQINGSGSQSLTGSVYNMIDKVVPAGANSFRLNSTAGLAVGQTVRVERPGTQAWINAIGMNVALGPEDPAWLPSEFNLQSDRIITRIEGNRVFLDAPLATSFDVQFGGGTLQRYTFSGRIQNVGVENLRGESDFNAAETSGSDFIDEDHAWTFLSTDKSQNVWFRNSLTKYFGFGAALAQDESKWFTVENVINEEPVSIVTGSRRYTFDLDGQMGFVTNSTAQKGRHDFVNNGAVRSAGPNVFHNSTATSVRSDTGPHRRWSTGTLFDNITVQGGSNNFNVRNRGDFGTTHGWSGANMVIWNSTSKASNGTSNGVYYVQNPPTSQNWLIGSVGTIGNDTTFGSQPPGYYDSSGTKVTVGGSQSLYDAQHNDSAAIRAFHWTAASGAGNWNDHLAWKEAVKPGVYKVQLRDYMLGDIDNFTNDGAGSVDLPYIDPAWQTTVLANSSHPIAGFDDSTPKRNIAFTIQHQLDSGERVVHGFLAVSLKATGTLFSTDFIRFFDLNASHQLSFNSLGWTSQISSTTPFVGVVDMGQFLDQLQTGSINVQLNDDTMTDWAIYTAAVATPIADPTGPAVFLEGGSVRVDSLVAPVASLAIGGPAASTLTIAAGNNVSVLDDYQQLANGTLTFEIGGLGMGQYGKLIVGDDATLGGTLAAQLVNGYVPSVGAAFEVLSANSLLGSPFANTSLPGLASALKWELIYEPDAVIAHVVAALTGDFNADGSVDGSDYVVWRNSLGSTVLYAGDTSDANRNGVIDMNDYDLWRAHFGEKVGTGSEANLATVPEPSAAVMLCLFVVVGLLGRRRCAS